MKKRYKATIITPFHNTDMSFFMKTYTSVKEQTIGFENIEWIVVLHNCAKEYIRAVRELLGEYENVKLLELVNDARSASSPRNYGLDFVTSPYIEFLDSDDSINPRTVEKCVEEIEMNHAQIVVFRMAYLKQSESVQSIITDVTLWNPLEERIVLTGEGLRCQELFSSINFCTHNRFFDAEFIRSNRIFFDEKITMAEDAYFTLTCYAKAKKIVVLPQFIGHNYYVNSSSAVQSMNKPAKDVLHFSYGFKKMFDMLIDIHAYYNHFFLTILTAYIHYAHCSDDFTPEDWKTLQRDMGPYARMITIPPVNKFFTEEDGKIAYQFVVKYLLESPSSEENKDYRNGEMNLAHILRMNRNTAFGKYYDFETISSIEEFRSRVPVYNHRMYGKLMRLHTEVGESELVTPKKIQAYAYDFDESGHMRTIPVTEEDCENYGRQFINKLIGETTFLMMESVPKGMLLNDGTYRDSIVGILVKSGIESFRLSDRELDRAFTSPFSLFFPKEKVRTDYLNLLLALRNEEVTQIVASNTWVVLNYIEMIIKYGENICRDIEEGTLHMANEKIRKLYPEALAANTPNPERAAKIREALHSENEGRLLQMIWPKLKRVLARNSGNYAFFTGKLGRYLGNVRTELADLITPFGIIAQSSEEENTYKLNTEAGFYEFLPASDADSGRTVLMTETHERSVYELILTNNSGIYRMHTNFFVRPVRVTGDGFRFEECTKPVFAEDCLLCDGNDLEKILEECTFGDLHDYFFCYNKEDKRLEILIESGKEDKDHSLSDSVERKLMRNKEYAAARSTGIEACRVRIIDKETRLLWRDLRRLKYNAPGDCFQPIHHIGSLKEIPLLKIAESE